MCMRDTYNILHGSGQAVSTHLRAMQLICIPLLKEKPNKGTRLQSYETVEFDPARTHMRKDAHIHRQACHPVCSVESHLKRFLSFVELFLLACFQKDSHLN